DVVSVEYLPQMLRDVFVAHRWARRRLQVALITPEVVGDAIHARLIVKSFAWQPERWLYMPCRIADIVADQHQCGQITRLRQVETANHVAAGKVERLAS